MKSTVTIWHRLRRTPYQAIGSVFMMFVTLFVLSVFLLLVATSSSILTYFESKPQLTVFFTNEKDKASIDQLVEKLKQTAKVSNWQYISKDQALAIYREQNKDDPLLLEMVTADILPASLDISTTSPQYLSEIYDMVKKEPGVDDVVFQKDVVDALISWSTIMRRVGAVFIVFLVISTFFILLTSVGMKIALRKDEIEILKLVGATTWYIRRPFIYEGLIYGVIGATLASAVSTVIVFYIQPYALSFLKGIGTLTFITYQDIRLNVWPPNILLLVSLWMILLAAGLCIGFFGSWYATSRYLKE